MIELRTFTPAEAAKISGVNATLQRDWRRRGFLPREDGPARFDPFAVAELIAMNALAQRGIGPQQAKLVSNWLAAGIVKEALQLEGACGGDFDLVLEWDEDFVEFYRAELARAPEDLVRGGIRHKRGQWLAHKVLLRRGIDADDVKPAFFWWADGSHGFYSSAAEALDLVLWSGGGEADSRISGAIIMLELSGLAALLVAGGPIATFSADTWKDQIAHIRAGRADAGGEDGRP